MERRRSARRPLNARGHLYYTGLHVARQCRVMNVSKEGLFIRIKPHALHPGRRITVVFRSGLLRRLRRVSATVIRVNDEGAAAVISKLPS